MVAEKKLAKTEFLLDDPEGAALTEFLREVADAVAVTEFLRDIADIVTEFLREVPEVNEFLLVPDDMSELRREAIFPAIRISSDSRPFDILIALRAASLASSVCSLLMNSKCFARSVWSTMSMMSLRKLRKLALPRPASTLSFVVFRTEKAEAR